MDIHIIRESHGPGEYEAVCGKQVDWKYAVLPPFANLASCFLCKEEA